MYPSDWLSAAIYGRRSLLIELKPPAERLRHAPHVVIVGGGFADIQACRALAQSEVRITLIEKRNFNLFQPLLYQVATGLVASGDIATPLRELVGKQLNVQILLGEVTQLIQAEHQIVFNRKTFSYDHFPIATGPSSSFFGRDNWRTFAPPIKNPRARRRNPQTPPHGDGASGTNSRPRSTAISSNRCCNRRWSERLRDGGSRLSNAAMVPK
jgi:hypothetical protein